MAAQADGRLKPWAEPKTKPWAENRQAEPKIGSAVLDGLWFHGRPINPTTIQLLSFLGTFYIVFYWNKKNLGNSRVGFIGRPWNHKPDKTAEPILGSASRFSAHGFVFGAAHGLSRPSAWAVHYQMRWPTW